MRIPFVGEAYTLPSLDVDAQNCINWFPVLDHTGKFPTSLFPVPGLEVYSSQEGTQCQVRGLKVINERFFGVVDSGFYEILNTGVRNQLGTLKTSIGQVVILTNQNQIGIFDGQFGYVYQLVTTDTRTEGDFFVIDKTSSLIGDPTFVGTGLDDMGTSGTYTGTNDLTYRVEIQSTGAPDKFRWSRDDGASWAQENINIITGNITLENGIQVIFSNTTGHTIGDYWTFQVTTDSTFFPPILPTSIDGYGIYPVQNSNRFFITGINDFSSVNALDFALVNQLHDDLVGCISIREELWFFSENIIRIYYNTGASQFPFEPRQNLALNFGLAAPYSLTVADNNILCWLGKNPEGQLCILAAAGYNPQMISTEPINNELAKYETIDDAIGLTYFYQGQLFYALIFPTEDKTWVYSFTTKMWHEHLSRHLNPQPREQEYMLGRWRANCVAYFDNEILVGDFENGNIYKLSQDYYTENGNMLILERTTVHSQADLNRIFLEWLQVDFEAGVGLREGQGSDPTVMLQFSKDGGHAWSHELWRSIGLRGEYKTRAKWNRLGYARNWTFRIRVTDPVYRVLIGAVGEVEVSEE